MRAVVVPDKKELLTRKELVVLSKPIGFPGFVAVSYQLKLAEALAMLEDATKIHCYHGHQETLDVINEVAGLNLRARRKMYAPKDGDVAMSIKLRKRLSQYGTKVIPQLEDLVFILTYYKRL